MFDPCGTRHVDGQDIINRLAHHLQTDPATLELLLLQLLAKSNILKHMVRDYESLGR